MNNNVISGADALSFSICHPSGYHEIREHAKNRDWKRATQLRLRQSLFQSQRMSPDFYFFQASFRSRLNHPHLRAEVLSKRCSAIFYVHPAGSPYSPNAGFQNGMRGGFISKTESFRIRGIFYHFPWKERYGSTKKFPFRPPFKILPLPGDSPA